MAKGKPQPSEGEAKATISLDLGLGGIFKGLGDFLDLVSDMAEKGQQEVTRTGTFPVRGSGGRATGVYGFTVRMGLGGAPVVERFGNIHATDEGPEMAEVREPLVDVFDEEQSIHVVAELPGVGEDEISIEIKEDILSVEATGERKYAKEILLPAAVDPVPEQKTYRNGILELRLKKAEAKT